MNCLMMNIQQQKKSNNHPLLRELNIGGDVNANVNVNVNVSANADKTEDAISASNVVSFLLDTNVLLEETIRNAVQTIRRKRQTIKDAIKDTENRPGTEEKIRNDVAKVDVASSNGNDNGNSKSKSKDDNNKITPVAAAAAASTIQNSTSTDRTRHVALRFFYDGASYTGLAQNIGQEDDNSVERHLIEALQKARLMVSRETSNFSRCGRTDRGVSAAGQVVALRLKSAFPANASWEEDGSSLVEATDLPKNEHESRKIWTIPRSKKIKKKNKSKKTKDNTADDSDMNTTTTTINRVEKQMTEYAYAKILNNILPPSIRILGWTPVTDDFSARFSASARTYRYFFCKRQMNTDAIREGLKRLVGKHDFRNLCKMNVEKVYNFERLIHTAELIHVQESTTSTSSSTSTKNGGGEVCYLKIIGQAFLWHQIRCIAKVLFMIGDGFESPSVITELLDVKKYPGKPSYALADEKPLVLHDCGYPNLQFGYPVQNLWTVSCQLEKQWEDLILAAARLRSGIESLRSCSVLKEDLIAFADSKLSERNKKLQRRGINTEVVASDDSLASSTIISWADGLPWLEKCNLVPGPTGVTNSVHVPLMKRSMGPSYEEKIENVKKSEKRRLKFEENVIKKRKTAEEDQAFYEHKIKQGGTGI